MRRSITGWIVGVAAMLFAGVGWAQTADTFAQRLAASQTVKRAVDIAAVRSAPANKVFYVRTTGNDANNGSTAARAVRTIQRRSTSLGTPGRLLWSGRGPTRKL